MRALIAAVVLGGAFGSASATVVSIEGNVMTVDIEVEVQVSAQSVVAHLDFDDDPTFTVPLLDRGEGRFGVVTQLEPVNYIVVFEVLGPEPDVSEPVSMAQLGVDLLPEIGTTTTTIPEEDGLSPDSRRLLWLAIALGAGSLSVLAFWVLGGRDSDSDGEDDGERDDDGDEEHVVE